MDGVATVPTPRALLFSLDVAIKQLHTATKTVDQCLDLRRICCCCFDFRPKTTLMLHFQYSNRFAWKQAGLWHRAVQPRKKGWCQGSWASRVVDASRVSKPPRNTKVLCEPRSRRLLWQIIGGSACRF